MVRVAIGVRRASAFPVYAITSALFAFLFLSMFYVLHQLDLFC